MKLILSFLTSSILILPQNTKGQYLDSGSIRLSNTLNRLIEKYKTPDAAFVVTRNDTVIFQLDKNPQNKNINYYIGSCSKSFTALALLQLADARKINLDTPIKQYLPWFELKDRNYNNQITVRHLLNQTSGFKTINGFFDFITTDQSIYESKLAAYIKTIELQSPPGAAFNYCNLNYVLAGLIITHVTNETYASYLKRNILSKIGMHNTFASSRESETTKLIPGYQYCFNLFELPAKRPYSDFFIPQGLISSNTTDLSAYLNCIRNNCITKKGDTLLSTSSYNLYTTPLKEGYAMGWMGNKIAFNSAFNRQYEIPFIYHTGLNKNYNAVLAIYPDKNISIVVLSNINSMEFSKEAMNIILSGTINKPYKSGYSMEILERTALLIVLILLTAGLFYNIYRWKKFNFRIGLTTKPAAVIRLVAGLMLSIIPLFIIPRMNNISLSSLLSWIPDFGYGLIIASGVGFISSIIRFEATFAKNYKKEMQEF